MAIWHRNYTLEEVRARGRGTMMDHLGIELTQLGDDFLEGTMPVDARTRQPEGILHGGASVALAESLASTAANLTVDRAKQYCVGLEINANHVSACREGTITGRARPIHVGRSTQVWETRMTVATAAAGKNGERLVCISRMTLAVLDRK